MRKRRKKHELKDFTPTPESLRVVRKIRQLSNKRGEENEERFLKALKEAQFPKWVRKIRLSTQDEDERKKRDVVVRIDRGTVSFQVKSSLYGVKKFRHQKENGELGKKDTVFPIEVGPDLTDEDLREEALRLLKRAREKKMKNHH